MPTIGRLHTIEENGYRQLRGEIQTLDLDLPIWLEGRSDTSSDQAPAYSIHTKGKTGKPIQIGSVWKKTIKSGRRMGEEFLSLTIDDPSFPATLNVAAFKTERPGEWQVTWRRRQDRLLADTDAA